MALYLDAGRRSRCATMRTAMFAPMAGNFVPLSRREPNELRRGAILQRLTRNRCWNQRCGAIVPLAAALPQALRTRRLLALTAAGPAPLGGGRTHRTANDWESRIYGRLSALAEAGRAPAARTDPRCSFRSGPRSSVFGVLLTGLICMSSSMRRWMPWRKAQRGCDRTPWRALTEARRAARPQAGRRSRLRMRGSILAMSDALAQHAAYFDSGGAQ